MANKIEITNISPQTVGINPLSRYANSTVVYYGDEKKKTFTTYIKPTYPSDSSDRFYVITAGEQFRPDLTSKTAYGTVDFWWKIMEANGIFDIFDYITGLTIRIPGKVF